MSRALRELPGVNAGTRQRILEAVAELDYVVSPTASALSRGATRRVAVVLPRLDSWFSATVLASVESTLRAGDLDVFVYQVGDRDERVRFFRDLPTRRNVDAVFMVALPMLPEEEERLDLMGVEVVVAGARLRDFPSVTVDDVGIGETAVAHLIGLGHTRIGMIRTSDTEGGRWTSDVHRREGYARAMAAQGLITPPELVVTEPYSVRAGADATARLLALPDPPTAVFCYSDDIAISALHTLRQRGIRVPEEMSVVGVDGTELSGLFELTTVDQHVALQARLAGEMVLHLLAGTPLAETTTTVSADLVVRASTAAPS